MERDLKIGDESESKIKDNLRINNFEHVIEAFDLGEVSFHSGWVFHRAGAKLMNPKNDNQNHDWNIWCRELRSVR